MEVLAALIPLFTVMIAFCAVFTALGLLFNILLNPIKKGIANLEQNQVKIDNKLGQLKIKLGQLEIKLDKALAR